MRQIWHPWTAWECYPAGMYDGPCKLSPEDAMQAYANFLRDLPRFKAAMERVMNEWPISCEHFLTNPNINRVAWLGQASMCIETGVSRKYRGGFNTMEPDERDAANQAAQQALDQWTEGHEAKDRELPECLGAEGVPGRNTGRSAFGIDERMYSPVIQGGRLCDIEERLHVAGVHAEKVEMV